MMDSGTHGQGKLLPFGTSVWKARPKTFQKCSKFLRRTNTYTKNEKGLQRTLDVLWVIHHFIRTHFTTKKVSAVARWIFDKKLSWDELIPMTA